MAHVIKAAITVSMVREIDMDTDMDTDTDTGMAADNG